MSATVIGNDRMWRYSQQKCKHSVFGN